eukprot:m.41417 g.41417  ORF g.41417 m.41417 type:complete len:80 (-) comp10423_c1_seq1:652-891(-)
MLGFVCVCVSGLYSLTWFGCFWFGCCCSFSTTSILIIVFSILLLVVRLCDCDLQEKHLLIQPQQLPCRLSFFLLFQFTN